MKPWKRKPEIVDDNEYCRCPPSHAREMHDEKGCTAEIVIFTCKNKPHSHENCIVKVPCRCHVKNGGMEIGVKVAEAEKTA